MVRTGEDVLLDFFHEALGRDHLQVFAFGVAEHPVDAAEVVGMWLWVKMIAEIF